MLLLLVNPSKMALTVGPSNAQTECGYRVGGGREARRADHETIAAAGVTCLSIAHCQCQLE